MREQPRLLEQPFPMHCFFAETFRWDWIINFMSSVETTAQQISRVAITMKRTPGL